MYRWKGPILVFAYLRAFSFIIFFSDSFMTIPYCSGSLLLTWETCIQFPKDSIPYSEMSFLKLLSKLVNILCYYVTDGTFYTFLITSACHSVSLEIMFIGRRDLTDSSLGYTEEVFLKDQ